MSTNFLYPRHGSRMQGCTVYRDGSRSGVLNVIIRKAKDRTLNSSVNGNGSTPNDTQTIDIIGKPTLSGFRTTRKMDRCILGLRRWTALRDLHGSGHDERRHFFLPKCVTRGKIIKAVDENGNKRYDFQFINKRGYKTTIEGSLKNSIPNIGIMQN